MMEVVVNTDNIYLWARNSESGLSDHDLSSSYLPNCSLVFHDTEIRHILFSLKFFPRCVWPFIA